MAQRGYRWLDITGQKFGRLTAVRCLPSKARGHSSNWECVCECGNRCLAYSCTLKRGGVRSCGCLKREQSRRWCSIGNGPRKVLLPGEAAFNLVYGIYAKGSKRRGLGWGLSRDQARALFLKNCHYCSAPPSREKTNEVGDSSFTCNGIDRVDNSDGYTINNCVPCCRQCNFAKSSMSYEDFTAWLDRIADARNNLRRGEKAVA